MPDAAPAARGVYEPRRPQASSLFRLVSDHLHRLQTVYDDRFAREYGPWRPVVAQVADKFCVGVRPSGASDQSPRRPDAHGQRGTAAGGGQTAARAAGARSGSDRAVWSADTRPI